MNTLNIYIRRPCAVCVSAALVSTAKVMRCIQSSLVSKFYLDNMLILILTVYFISLSLDSLCILICVYLSVFLGLSVLFQSSNCTAIFYLMNLTD